MKCSHQARQIRVDQGQMTDSIFEISEMVVQSRVIFRGVNVPYVSTPVRSEQAARYRGCA